MSASPIRSDSTAPNIQNPAGIGLPSEHGQVTRLRNILGTQLRMKIPEPSISDPSHDAKRTLSRSRSNDFISAPKKELQIPRSSFSYGIPPQPQVGFEELKRVVQHLRKRSSVDDSLSDSLKKSSDAQPSSDLVSSGIMTGSTPLIKVIPSHRVGNPFVEADRSRLSDQEMAYEEVIDQLDESALIALQQYWTKDDLGTFKQIIKEHRADKAFHQKLIELAKTPLMGLMLKRLSIAFLATPLAKINPHKLARDLVSHAYHIVHADEQVSFYPDLSERSSASKFKHQIRSIERVLNGILDRLPVDNYETLKLQVLASLQKFVEQVTQHEDNSALLCCTDFIKELVEKSAAKSDHQANYTLLIHILRGFSQDLYVHSTQGLSRHFSKLNCVKTGVDYLFQYTFDRDGKIIIDLAYVTEYSIQDSIAFSVIFRNRLSSTVASPTKGESEQDTVIDSVKPLSSEMVEKPSTIPKFLIKSMLIPLLALGLSADAYLNSVVQEKKKD